MIYQYHQKILKKFIICLKNTQTKFIQTKNLPFNMNVFGFTSSILNKLIKNEQRKIIWTKIFNEIKNIIQNDIYNNNDVRLSLDYIEDFNLFKILLENNFIYKIDKEIYNYIISNNLIDINSFRTKEYWLNFNKEKNNN